MMVPTDTENAHDLDEDDDDDDDDDDRGNLLYPTLAPIELFFPMIGFVTDHECEDDDEDDADDSDDNF